MRATAGASTARGEIVQSRKRMSCNGCRVLRKGCSDTCILRPCLQWIESAEAQGHATVFVAKFFGRAGLMSFISAVPDNQRPALFQSLLYEACGRTVNPVNGAVGLLWSGNWQICQAAVETVLKGGILRPPQSSSGVIATCSTRPSLTNNNFQRICNRQQAMRPAEEDYKCVPDFSLQGNSHSNYRSPQQPQPWTTFKIKAEPFESTHDLSLPKIHHPPPSEMAVRRVRPRVDGNEASSNLSKVSASDVKFLGEFQAEAVELKANLDLTLNCENSFKKRVSSPSIVS
ncbi:hypothetical protein KI387_022210, partial [Taxus chinensis]